MDEKALVESVLNGDYEAFEEIVDKYKNKLYSFLVKMTLSKQDAEEILQEVFIRVYNNLDKYDDRWMFSTWIYRIAVNSCRSFIKKRKRHTTVPIHNELGHSENDGAGNPEETFEAAERRQEIIFLIRELNEKQRIPLILKYVKGFSYFEIGRIMGISEGAAKMKVSRARENILKRYIERHRGDLS